MTLDQFFEVWTVASITAAVAAGLVIGLFLVGRYASDPAYASGVASPVDYALLVLSLTAAVGAVFYGLQILTTFIGGDTSWTRVVSRFGLWVLYSGAIGLGTWIRLRRHLARKQVEAHDKAVADRDEPS